MTAPFPRSRRTTILVGLALALLGGACSSSKPKPITPTAPAPGSILERIQGASQISLIQAQSEITTGKNLFSFGLGTQNGQLIEGGSPQVWAAPDTHSTALGPFAATFYRFTADQQFKDNAPKSPLTGFYVANVNLPAAGNWDVAAIATVGSQKLVGTGLMKVVTVPSAPAVGSKAISVKTPVATTEAGLRQIDTRDPPSTMHYISLDQALKNGKPTVVVFSTPLLCTSRMCGPVTDEVYAVFFKVGRQTANFIHVEEFLPGPSLQPPPATEANQSPGFKAWHLLTEPWTFVIDRHGVIRARFEGPVVASEIEAALKPLLS